MSLVRLVLLALLVAVAGCESAPPAPPPTGSVPDLRGTWTGTWGGAPVTLVVTGEEDVGAGSGVYLGSWQVLGQRNPGLSGVLTTTVRGERVSLAATGRLTSNAGRPAVLLTATGPAGAQELRLTHVAPDRLRGTGESSYAWGPRGVAELTRVSRPSP
jgi:hypothetical protein